MVTRSDYPQDGVVAARAVLIELGHLLGEYRDDIVVIGGWVPELLFATAEVHHIGSLDVDLALNHRTLQEAGYRTIHELLLGRGYYQQLGDQPFRYYRKVPIAGHEVVVEVDFLAGEYAGTARRHRTQKVQEMQPRKARGCDLAFGLSTEVSVGGLLPDGSPDSTRIRVANIVPFLVMKAIALDARMKEKDAWDIYYCLSQYPEGLDRLAEAFKPHLGHRLVQEGLLKLAGKFRSPEDFGPASVARFEELGDPEARALRQRDAFERMAYLLRKLGYA
jgi:hypothetical protein